jgi:hypothetical protein
VITFDLLKFVPLFAKDIESCSISSGGTNSFVGEGVVLHASTIEHPTRKTSAFVNFANPNYGYSKFITGFQS